MKEENRLAAEDPVVLRDRLLHGLWRICETAPSRSRPSSIRDPHEMLESVDVYLGYLRELPGVEIDVAIETETHALLTDPLCRS